jgi:hypothetical protein
VGAGRNIFKETDTPGETTGAQATDTRFTIHIRDEFETFLMWRADAAAPVSDWLTYGSGSWLWDATATGVTSGSTTMWLAPTEAFSVCSKALQGSTGLKIPNGAPHAATHLSLPIHTKSAASTPTRAFPSASAKDQLEQNCP